MSPKTGYRLIAKPLQQNLKVTLKVDARKEPGAPVVELSKPAVLPFLPRQADELAVGWDGEYMTVSTVFWCPNDGITVWLEDSDGVDRLKQLRSDGWADSYPAPHGCSVEGVRK